MAFNGSTIVAKCIEDKNLIILTEPLSSFLQNNHEEFPALPEDILKKLAFLHSRGIAVGAELLNPNEVLIVESTEGPQAILKIQRGGSSSSVEEDIGAVGKVLNYIWTFRSRLPDALEQDLVSKMLSEDPIITAAEAQAHFAIWPSSKRMSFIMAVSDTLELKQKQHLDAVEKQGRLVIFDSWILKLAPLLREKVERDSRKRRRYSATSVTDLLRFARNLTHHYQPLAQEVRAALGPFEKLGNFWTSTFPLLLPHLHQAMHKFRGDTNCARIRSFYL